MNGPLGDFIGVFGIVCVLVFLLISLYKGFIEPWREVRERNKISDQRIKAQKQVEESDRIQSRMERNGRENDVLQEFYYVESDPANEEAVILMPEEPEALEEPVTMPDNPLVFELEKSIEGIV